MQPTMKLRWISKSAIFTVGVEDADVGGRYVLQQWWYQPLPEVDPEYCDGEWRDIPIEVEK